MPVGTQWSQADANASGLWNLSNGGLTASMPSGGNWGTLRTTTSKAPGSGKWYIEVYVYNFGASSAGNQMFGLANAAFSPAAGNYLGLSTYSVGLYFGGPQVIPADAVTWTANYNPPNIVAIGDVWALAVDTLGSFWFARNNVWQSPGNPAAGTSPIVGYNVSTTGPVFMGLSTSLGGDTFILQPSAATQTYAPPAGFLPWDGAAGAKAGSAALMVGV